MEKRKVAKTMTKWIVNMLRCRNIHQTYQGNHAEVKVVKGCPHPGSVQFLSYGVWRLINYMPRDTQYRDMWKILQLW